MCDISGMQLLPNKLYLAMNAAMFIAYNGTEEVPVAGSEIVEYSNLNKRALEPVLQKLSSAGLIISVKGAKGGYYMPTPESTSLRDIARAFISSVVPDKHEFSGYDVLIDVTLMQSHDRWLESLSDVTFKQLCQRARNSGQIPAHKAPVLNFAI